MRWFFVVLVFGLFLTGLVAGCQNPPDEVGDDEDQPGAMIDLDPKYLRPFKPLPAEIATQANPLTEAKISLGRMLYFEDSLFAEQRYSCNSCHDLTASGTSIQRTQIGHLGQSTARDALPSPNAAAKKYFFWDGRADSLEGAISTMMLAPPTALAEQRDYVIKALRGSKDYQQAFAAAFPGQSDAVTLDNIYLAIGAFMRRLMIPGRLDNYLEGAGAAITNPEIHGLIAFTNKGCIACHDGVALGGASFAKLGVKKPWPDLEDAGRFAVTGNEEDRGVFAVASLRGVTQTSPYFHDGSVDDLAKAADMMAEYQTGNALSRRERAQIVAFLETVSGQMNIEYAFRPVVKQPPQANLMPKPAAAAPTPTPAPAAATPAPAPAAPAKAPEPEAEPK